MAAGRNPKLGYDNFDRDLTEEQRAAFLAEGRQPVVRLRMPDARSRLGRPGARRDHVRARARCPTSCSTRGNGIRCTHGQPVDDALMRSPTCCAARTCCPRPRARSRCIRRSSGSGSAERTRVRAPADGIGEGSKKLSKRDPQSNLFLYRERGFVPEGLLNYLALLGWSIADDRDVFSLDEMVAAFDVVDCQSPTRPGSTRRRPRRSTPSTSGCSARTTSRRAAAILRPRTAVASRLDDAGFAAAAHLVQTRIMVLGDARDAAVPVRRRGTRSRSILRPPRRAGPGRRPGARRGPEQPGGAQDWTATEIEAALKGALIEGLGLKPRKAFGPIRVAVTGRTVRPPLFESMELLGRDRACSGCGPRRRCRSSFW